MKLYDFALSPSPRRVRIFLAEKGVDIPKESVNLREKEQMRPEFRVLNPWLTLPVLQLDDGTCISEAIAVSRYLEAAFPEPPLFGATPQEKGVVAMWEHRAEQDGFLAVAEVLRNSVDRFADRALTGPLNHAQIPALAERGKRRVGQFFDWMDTRLAETEFLAGPTYTVADITALVSVDFAAWVELKPGDTHPHLARWHAAVSARPSAQA